MTVAPSSGSNGSSQVRTLNIFLFLMFPVNPGLTALALSPLQCGSDVAQAKTESLQGQETRARSSTVVFRLRLGEIPGGSLA